MHGSQFSIAIVNLLLRAGDFAFGENMTMFTRTISNASIAVIVGLIIATIGCSPYRPKKSGVATQSSLLLQALQIDRAGLPESSNGRISLKGQCASEGSVSLVMTDIAAIQNVSCVAGKFLIELNLIGEDGLKTLRLNQTTVAVGHGPTASPC